MESPGSPESALQPNRQGCHRLPGHCRHPSAAKSASRQGKGEALGAGQQAQDMASGYQALTGILGNYIPF